MTNGLLILYMTKYLCISSYIRKPFLLYMTLQPLPSEFPYIGGKFSFFFIGESSSNKNPSSLQRLKKASVIKKKKQLYQL